MGGNTYFVNQGNLYKLNTNDCGYSLIATIGGTVKGKDYFSRIFHKEFQVLAVVLGVFVQQVTTRTLYFTWTILHSRSTRSTLLRT
jgi:hypothetical protein